MRTTTKKKAGGTKLSRSAKRGFGQELIANMREFRASVERGEPVTVRHVKVSAPPNAYNPAQIRQTRERLGVSQAILAGLLAVKVKAYQAWEQGERPASGMVRRVLDEINREPHEWLKRRLALVSRQSQVDSNDSRRRSSQS